jgi:predicted acetyltransferase
MYKQAEFVMERLRIMDSLLLRKASRELEHDIMDYRKEFIERKELNIYGSCGLVRYNNFNEWLEHTLSIEKDILEKDKVNATTYFCINEDDERIVGSIQLRHALTNELRAYGGHIGYSIRPTMRRRGYGTEQLALALEEAKRMGIPKVMVCCDRDNPASAAVILRNGGIFEWEGLYEPTGEIIQKYWIQLSVS